MFKPFIFLIILSSPFAFAKAESNLKATFDVSENLTAIDEYTFESRQSYDDIPPINEDGTINVIIEVPAGTSDKWEVSQKSHNQMVREFKDNQARSINYLAYPGNYGAIAGTFLPREEGGDDDLLDVLVLGEALPRGEIVSVRLIGILRLLDNGEKDDKIIAVMTEHSPFANVKNLADLQENYEGVLEIVKIWFTNYNDVGDDVRALGYAGERAAMEVLNEAITMYNQRKTQKSN